MSSERDLLRRLEEALAAADVDAGQLVESAWADAREEVHTTLKRLMARDLLRRAVSHLDGEELAASSPEPPAAPHVAPAERRFDAGGSSTSSRTYLFGIVADDVPLPAGELPALPGGGELRFLDGPGCRALVCDVDPQLFEELREPGPEGLDLLAAAAHAHDAILGRFAGAAVLPLALGTALADDEAVQRLLDGHAAQLQHELERFDGHTEWAVTVHTFDRDAGGESSRAPTSGREYLRARRAELGAREDRWEFDERLASALHEPLTSCAVEAHRVVSRPLEEAAPPLLHGVYLLDERSRSRFDSTVAYLRSEHPDAVIEVSGPWPPYHFVSLDLASDGEPA